MKILMLCPMLSSSSFITTYPPAKILSKKHEVTIVGPLFGKESPYVKDSSLKFEYIEPVVRHPVQVGMLSLFPKNFSRLMKNDYDVVHVFKLLPHTAPAAAFAKKFTKKPLVLSIDDYDAVGGGNNPVKKMFLKWAEKSYKSADSISVSTTFLQSIYGGEVIYQVANEEIFLDQKIDGDEIRKKYGLEDKIVILHAGTLYEHKGVDLLIKAVQKIGRPDVKLLIVGGTINNNEIEYYKNIAGEETIFTGHVPIQEIPKFVAACDIYAIPTKLTDYTRVELPAKIFEPMMMGKAIISTSISDVPEILDNGNAGIVVEPNSVDSLADGLDKLINEKILRKKIGIKAKERYIENYSYENIEKKLNVVYSKVGVS